MPGLKQEKNRRENNVKETEKGACIAPKERKEI